jgi:hypothetical protein
LRRFSVSIGKRLFRLPETPYVENEAVESSATNFATKEQVDKIELAKKFSE